MENKYVGLLLIGITIIFFFIVFSFNWALEDIVNANCDHGLECSMHTSLKVQKIISYSLTGMLILVGLFVTFFLKEKTPPAETKKNFSEEEKQKRLENLDKEEKKIVNALLLNQGSHYQSDLIKETQLTKVKTTRILDKLEGKGLIERKRRGMTNIVILK